MPLSPRPQNFDHHDLNEHVFKIDVSSDRDRDDLLMNMLIAAYPSKLSQDQ